MYTQFDVVKIFKVQYGYLQYVLMQ